MTQISKEQLEAVQSESQKILTEIDSICEKHNLKYFLFAGTLLGAIRHQGFIPWDDDCDVGMMRDDFEKFRIICQTELSSDFFFQDQQSDPNYRMKLIKIRSNNLGLIEHHESGQEPYHHGVYVDVFVFDYYPESAKRVFGFLNGYLHLKRNRTKLKKGSLKRFLLNFSLIPWAIAFVCVRKLYKTIYQRTRKVPSTYIGASMFHENFTSLFKAEDILPITEKVSFNGVDLYIPNNTNSMLTQLYGDYMKLPPENQRVWHAKDVISLKQQKSD